MCHIYNITNITFISFTVIVELMLFYMIQYVMTKINDNITQTITRPAQTMVPTFDIQSNCPQLHCIVCLDDSICHSKCKGARPNKQHRENQIMNQCGKCHAQSPCLSVSLPTQFYFLFGEHVHIGCLKGDIKTILAERGMHSSIIISFSWVLLEHTLRF